MTTKYCLRKELDTCLLEKPMSDQQIDPALFLEDNTGKYRLEFECKECQMKIYST
jgi:putative protease